MVLSWEDSVEVDWCVKVPGKVGSRVRGMFLADLFDGPMLFDFDVEGVKFPVIASCDHSEVDLEKRVVAARKVRGWYAPETNGDMASVDGE